MGQEFVFKIPQEDQGKRLDLFVLDALKREGIEISREYAKVLIERGLVKKQGGSVTNEEKVLKPHHKLKLDDLIKIEFREKEPLKLEPQDIPLEIIYEDDDILIVNKPCGMVVHPAPGNFRNTLVNAALFHCKKLSGMDTLRPGIVHRLDKDASGIMVIAKNDASYFSLVKQFRQHKITRKYIAIASGMVQFDQGVVDLPIGQDPLNRTKMSVRFTDNARDSKTIYKTLKRFDNFSLLELSPQTGRTHQLRVHLRHLGHPILGDVKYGKDKKYSRLFLHSIQIGFTHPSRKKFVEFRIDTPKEFKDLIESAQS